MTSRFSPPCTKGSSARQSKHRAPEGLECRAEGVIRGGRLFRVNDKVMQIVNNYDKDVYNGDIGRIDSIDAEAQEIIVTFDERDIVYDYADLDELVHAYAVSVHKSQGSEYPAVVVPILTHHYVLLQRNLLYTAVTRGRSWSFLWNEKGARDRRQEQ